jgi:hypothetical protein
VRSSVFRAALLVMLSVIMGAPPAMAQLRPNMPAVETPPQRVAAEASTRSTTGAFRAWSEANGRPTFLLFWNRELSDETTTRSRLRLTDDVLVRHASGGLSSQRDVVIENERTTDASRDTLSAATSDAIQSGFVTAFMNAGGQIMDRNALMRRVSVTAETPDRGDQQFVEALALQQGVDYLIELLADGDGRSSTGLSFSIKVTDLQGSRIVARFVSRGAPPEARRRLVAAAGGFQRESETPDTPDAIGAQLAVETMASLL